MGAYLSEPVTEKFSEDESMERLIYGASSMQGWRVSQEDAHNCIPCFDENTSLFAVYDGHGGAEVAQYCALHLPNYIKSTKAYNNGNIAQALEDAFLEFDSTLIMENVLQELKQLAGLNDQSNDPEDGENEVNYLYEEAHMPLEELLARYHKSSAESQLIRNVKSDTHPQSPCLRAKGLEAGIDKNDMPGPSRALISDDQSPSTNNSTPEECKNESATSDSNHVATVSLSGLQEQCKNGDNGEHSKTSTEINMDGSGDGLCKKEQTNGEEKIDGKEKVTSPSTLTLSTETNKTPDEPVSATVGLVNGTDSSCNEKAEERIIDSGPGKGKGKSKGKSVVGFALCEPLTNSMKDGEVRNSRKQPVRKGGHREARPISMEDNSGESDSETDEEYEGVVSEHEDEGDSSCENEEEPNDNEESSDDEDDDDDEEDEEEEDEDVKNDEDSILVSEKEEPGYDSGCTAVVAILRGDDLYVANAGDSRCVVCRKGKAIEMSHDHKPEDEPETKRIVAAGGKVTSDGRVNGGLNLSRAIGDHLYKKNDKLPPRDQMISALPDIRTLTIDPEEDEFIVVACDGIWNYMNSQEVVDFIRERLPCENKKLSSICEELFDKCLAPSTLGDGTGCDNMTCIIVQFNKGFNQGSSKRKINSCTETDGNVEETPKRPRSDEQL